MTSTVICAELPAPVLEALDRFRAEMAGNKTRQEALAEMVTDKLIGDGFLDAPPDDE